MKAFISTVSQSTIGPSKQYSPTEIASAAPARQGLFSIIRRAAVALTAILVFTQCTKDYLDVVPDNVATIDHSFANRNEAEKFLFTCYSYLPQEGHPDMNPAISTGDEAWTYWPMSEDYFELGPYEIARNEQNK